MSSSGWTPPHLTHTARGGRTGTAANSAFGTWKEKVKDIPAELSPCIHCLHGYIINFTAKSIFTSYVSHSSKSSMAIRGHKNEWSILRVWTHNDVLNIHRRPQVNNKEIIPSHSYCRSTRQEDDNFQGNGNDRIFFIHSKLMSLSICRYYYNRQPNWITKCCKKL